MFKSEKSNYKRTRRVNGQMIYRPTRIGNGLMVQADKTVYRDTGKGWRKVGTLQTRTGKII